MNKMLWIAWREFSSTVFTKGFLFGVVMMPLMLVVVGGAVVWMKNFSGPRIQGTVAVIDQSGLVAPRLQERFSPDFEKKEAEETAQKIQEELKKNEAAQAAMALGGPQAQEQTKAAMEQAVKAGPEISLVVLDDNADVEKEKEPVKNASIRRASDDGVRAGDENRLALIVVPPGAVRMSDGKFEQYQAFFAQKLDGEVQQKIQRRVSDSIVDARLETDERLAKAGLSPRAVRELFARPAAEAKTLTPAGEKKALGELTMFIPMAFMILLMMSVMTSGSALLTTTVEEKSTRVIEVLLSAVSPMQLMTGKILGQMGVGILILVVYAGMGVGSLAYFLNRLDLVSAASLAYLGIFFLIAYFLFASMMAAIGSAVNDMREAQTLMTPVMMVMMIPWMIWFAIQRAPNSTVAVVLSFVPVTNPFVMVIRLSGSEPVPAWQIPVAIGVGLLSVIGAAWAAAKIFRIGALMYGKPPNFATLVRWVRMA